MIDKHVYVLVNVLFAKCNNCQCSHIAYVGFVRCSFDVMTYLCGTFYTQKEVRRPSTTITTVTQSLRNSSTAR